MSARRWWDLVFVAGAVACTALAASGQARTLLPFAAWMSAIPFDAAAATWLLLGARPWGRVFADRWFWLLLVAASAASMLLDPALAATQAVVYPYLWWSAATMRAALVRNAVTFVVVAAALMVAYRCAWPPTLVVAGASVAFSIIMGTWITTLVDAAESRSRLRAALIEEEGAAAERDRISRELHDTIAQGLAGIVLLVERARAQRAGGELEDTTLELVEDAARTALADTRTLVATTSDPRLDQGLPSALNRLAATFGRETGVRVSVDAPHTFSADRSTEVVLLRCAQEGLANVRKHAGASQVRLELTVDGADAVLRVVDDGVGVAAEPPAQGGFGLQGLARRLDNVGGSLEFGSVGDRGARLEVRVPS